MLKNFYFTLLTTLVFTFFSQQHIMAQDTNFHIYLCFGQSNMEGQGVIEVQDTIGNERFKVLQALDCPNLQRSKGNWYTAIPPLSQCHSGLSPSDYFGRTMVGYLPDSITVGVINVAVGGCDIRLFDKDIYPNYDDTYKEDWFTKKVAGYDGNPYEYLLNLAKKAQRDGVIKGILLHQGETNTGDTEWPQYVRKIYDDLLSHLSLEAADVPLIAGEVVSVPNSCCTAMNDIINRLPEVVETAHVISSDGCSAMDEAHFDSEGYREMGRRYAKKMYQILQHQ